MNVLFNLAVLKSPNKWKKRNTWSDAFIKNRQKSTTCNVFQKYYKKNIKIIKNKNLYIIDRFSKRIHSNEFDIDSVSLVKIFNTFDKK